MNAPARSTSRTDTLAAGQDRYRSPADRATRERQLIIDLARRWIPYGGPPDEEIFQLFGINRVRYLALLWETVRTVDRNGRLTAELATTYPQLPLRPGRLFRA